LAKLIRSSTCVSIPEGDFSMPQLPQDGADKSNQDKEHNDLSDAVLAAYLRRKEQLPLTDAERKHFEEALAAMDTRIESGEVRLPHDVTDPKLCYARAHLAIQTYHLMELSKKYSRFSETLGSIQAYINSLTDWNAKADLLSSTFTMFDKDFSATELVSAAECFASVADRLGHKEFACTLLAQLVRVHD
jgi:hypothetical protein